MMDYDNVLRMKDLGFGGFFFDSLPRSVCRFDSNVRI